MKLIYVVLILLLLPITAISPTFEGAGAGLKSDSAPLNDQEQILDDQKRAEEEWRVLEYQEHTAEEWLDIGTTLYHQGKYTAISAYDKAIELDPNLTDAWFLKGKALLPKEGPRAAGAFYECVKLDPQNATAWGYYGEALLHSSSDSEKALQAFNKSIELDPTNAVVWFNKGIALRQSVAPPGALNDPQFAGMYEAAIEAFDKALEIDPQYTAALVEKGITFERHLLGKNEEAMNAYDEAIRLDPNSSIAWTARGNFLSGIGFRDPRNYDEAIESFDKAIDIDPKNWQTWLGLQDALEGKGAFEDAYHIQDCAGSPDIDLNAPKCAAALSDHKNRAKYRVEPAGPESFSYKGWTAQFDVNLTNYSIRDESDLQGGGYAYLAGQEVSIDFSVIRVSSPKTGVGLLKLVIMPSDQKRLFLSDPGSLGALYPMGMPSYRIAIRVEDNGTVALALVTYTGYKSNPFENIRLTHTGSTTSVWSHQH